MIGWYLVRYNGGYGDEHWAHMPHILQFAHGNFSLEQNILPMIPGYHTVMAALSRLTGMESQAHLRLLSLLISLPSVYFFYHCAKSIKPAIAGVTTLQYFLLPILFPFFPDLHGRLQPGAAIIRDSWISQGPQYLGGSCIYNGYPHQADQCRLAVDVLYYDLCRPPWCQSDAGSASATHLAMLELCCRYRTLPDGCVSK